MTAQIGQFLGLDRAGVAHALRLAFAAWLAFAIASFLHVGNAYWAAMPIWVVSQSAKGLLLERGFFRVVGTLLGAAIGFGILQLDIAPYFAFALLGLWVALNATLIHLLRGVHGYGAMMAGMTAAIVILPSILHPDQGVQIATARVECTLIGVIVVTLVTGFWTPHAPRQDFYHRVRLLTKDALGFLAAMPPEDETARERQILQEMSAIQASASLVTAGSLEGYRRLHHVHTLIVAALNVMAAAQASKQRQRRNGSAAGISAGDADPRLSEALNRLMLADKVFETEPKAAEGQSFASKASYLAPHHDGVRASEAGLIAGAATFAASALGYASGWPAGELTALGVCIFSMVLGAQPIPRIVAPIILKGVSAGVAVALLYRLIIQPHVTTVPDLLLSVAPFILLGGLARASKKTVGPALDANMCFLLASQAVLPAITDRIVILNEAVALMLAAGVVTCGFMLLPPRPDRRAARAAKAITADLLRLTRLRRPLDPAQRMTGATRQILRLSLHLEKATQLENQPGWSLLGALNLGDAIGRLHLFMARPDADEAARQVLVDALAALPRMCQDPIEIAGRLEEQADAVADAEAGDILRDAAAALRASSTLLMYGGKEGEISPA